MDVRVRGRKLCYIDVLNWCSANPLLCGLKVKAALDLDKRWSERQVVPLVTRVWWMARTSRCLVIMKSIWCQWPDHGCIHVVLWRFSCWKIVFVIESSFCAHRDRSRGGLFWIWHAGPKLKIRKMPIKGTFVLTFCVFLLWKKSQGHFVNWIGREGVHDTEEPST